MKTATVKQIKDELSYKSANDLKELCLHLSRFKKENKELLTYLLFEAHDEEAYVISIKNQIDAQFDEINTKSYYYIRKSCRKILSQVKKYIKCRPWGHFCIFYCTKLQNVFLAFETTFPANCQQKHLTICKTKPLF